MGLKAVEQGSPLRPVFLPIILGSFFEFGYQMTPDLYYSIKFWVAFLPENPTWDIPRWKRWQDERIGLMRKMMLTFPINITNRLLKLNYVELIGIKLIFLKYHLPEILFS